MTLVLVQQKLVPKEHHSRHAIITQKHTACHVVLLNYPSYLLSTLFLLYLVWHLFVLHNFPQLPFLPALRLWDLKTVSLSICCPEVPLARLLLIIPMRDYKLNNLWEVSPTWQFLGTSSTSCNIITLVFHQMWMWPFGFRPVDCTWLLRRASLKKREINPKKLTHSSQKYCMELLLGAPHLTVLGLAWQGIYKKCSKKLLNMYFGMPWDPLN